VLELPHIRLARRESESVERIMSRSELLDFDGAVTDACSETRLRMGGGAVEHSSILERKTRLMPWAHHTPAFKPALGERTA